MYEEQPPAGGGDVAVPGLKRGYVQVYTGTGKGKTTAALGLALRAAGAGLRVFIIQLMKEYPYSELESLKALADRITIEQSGDDAFVYRNELPSEAQKAKAQAALDRAAEMMTSGDYDVVVLDEACVAIYFRLVTEDDVLAVLEARPDDVELVLTGRYCPEAILERADLVSEMREVKHYYETGVLA
ncbi:MAG: cob(I)yrinic acid a,c-diamide adenosyltransferase, partial [Gemmatimonadota bacterium]